MATGCATSCSTTRAARTASTAGCFPGTATTEGLTRRENARRKPRGSRRAAASLLLEREGGRLAAQHVLVGHRYRLAVLGGRDANLVRDLPLAPIGLLDGVVVYPLQRHDGVSGIPRDRVLLAVELRVIALAVPVHGEMLALHLVPDGAQRIVRLAHLLQLPGAGDPVCSRGGRGHAFLRVGGGGRFRSGIVRELAAQGRPVCGHRDVVCGDYLAGELVGNLDGLRVHDL